ncbi:MAG TPA: DUF454 family protein, partial [Candidatus Blautia ornithocaccae]|nr:DUF454 family protein [Candidatus Blautia ornithocaccae]
MRKTKKILWIMLGFISLGVGAVGVVLPLLPSFPFLLLTLISFAKSSKKLEDWFRNNGWAASACARTSRRAL